MEPSAADCSAFDPQGPFLLPGLWWLQKEDLIERHLRDHANFILEGLKAERNKELAKFDMEAVEVVIPVPPRRPVADISIWPRAERSLTSFSEWLQDEATPSSGPVARPPPPAASKYISKVAPSLGPVARPPPPSKYISKVAPSFGPVAGPPPPPSEWLQDEVTPSFEPIAQPPPPTSRPSSLERGSEAIRAPSDSPSAPSSEDDSVRSRSSLEDLRETYSPSVRCRRTRQRRQFRDAARDAAVFGRRPRAGAVSAKNLPSYLKTLQVDDRIYHFDEETMRQEARKAGIERGNDDGGKERLPGTKAESCIIEMLD